MRNEVLRAIRQLPDKQREVTTLFYINGYSQKDIADFLEVPVGTVKNRLHASRGRLKERMLNMVEKTLHQNAPDERFDKKVIDELLARPKPLEISEHPVRRVWEAIRQALSDYEVIEGPEVIARSSFAAIATPVEESYHLDHGRALRPETTVVTFAAISGRTAPVRLMTAGRVFRTGEEDRTHTNVFHQAEILHLDTGLEPEDMKSTVRRVVEAALGARELRWDTEDFPQVQQGHSAAANFGGRWIDLVGCGMLHDDTLRDAGYDPRTVKAYGIGLGLERVAMLKYGIDDIRELWQPPYVND